MQSKPSDGWPFPASTHWCKSFIPLISAVNLAWLLGISSLGFDPPKTMVVSEPLLLSLSLSGPLGYCLCGDWFVYWVSCTSVVGSNSVHLIHSAISLISISDSSEHSLGWCMCLLTVLLWQPDMCRAIYVTNTVELLTKQEGRFLLGVVHPSF